MRAVATGDVRCLGFRGQEVLDWRRNQHRQHRRHRGTPANLLAQAAARIADDHPGNRLQQHAVLLRQLLRRTHEDAAGPVDHMRFQARRDQAHDLVLQLLAVTGQVLVPDHQIDGQSFQAPVRMRLHQLPHQFDVGRIADLQQHHRVVAGDRLAPQPGLAAAVLQQHGLFGAQRGVGVQHQSGEALVQLRIGLRGVDLPAHDLAVGPGEVEHAVGQPPVAVLLDESGAGLARGANAGHHVDARSLPRRQDDAGADRDDWIEHRARGVGQRVGVGQRTRALQCLAAADEARAVGFVGDCIDVRVVHGQQVEHPRRCFIVPTRASGADDGLLVGHQLGLHEQIAEGRMQLIGNGWCQHHFRVAGDLDRALLARAVGDAQAAQLDVVFGRHRDFGMRLVTVLAAAELGLGVGEDRFVAFDRHCARLVRSRPELAAADVAQVAEAAPVVARAVLAPARDRHVLRAAVTTAGAAEHDVVAAVGQDLHRRTRHVGAAENAQLGFGDLRQRAGAGDLRRMRMEHAGARDTLLQQQQGRLELGVGDEALLHWLIAQQVCQRQQAHALVVDHERAHHSVVLSTRQARAGVVDRFVQAEAAGESFSGEPLQVLAGRLGCNHQRHHARVRGDHQVLREAALQAQTGHAERAVLVVHARIDQVVARLRHAPRHAALAAVVDLALDRIARGLVEQGALVAWHHQLRHQVLEHRAAP